MADGESGPFYGVWLKSCPRRSRRMAVEVLRPRLGLIEAEREVRDPGGRCVAVFSDKAAAEQVSSALIAAGCVVNAAEVAPWP